MFIINNCGQAGHAWAITRHNDPHLLNTLWGHYPRHFAWCCSFVIFVYVIPHNWRHWKQCTALNISLLCEDTACFGVLVTSALSFKAMDDGILLPHCTLFKKKIFEDINPFCGATDTCYGFLVISPLCFKPNLQTLFKDLRLLLDCAKQDSYSWQIIMNKRKKFETHGEN